MMRQKDLKYISRCMRPSAKYLFILNFSGGYMSGTDLDKIADNVLKEYINTIENCPKGEPWKVADVERLKESTSID